MSLFGKKETDPNLVCPRCGGPKSASLPICTTCKMKEAADANPFGFPGSEKEKEMRAKGQRFTGTPPPGAPPAGTRASIPANATVAPVPLAAPVPAPVATAPLPGAAPERGSFADPYSLNRTNYPLRTKQGVWVRSQGEKALADLLYDRGIAFAYEPTVARYRPTLLIPSAKLCVEVASALTPLPAWQKGEREAGYRGEGYELAALDEAKALDPVGAIGARLPK
ncbi:MAG: hypothetical protein ACYDCK_12705 [Thermoplasmatota archaeon]